MKKILVVGAGNVGICAAKAIIASGDMEFMGFVRKSGKPALGFEDFPVMTLEDAMTQKPDGAVICVPSRDVGIIAECCIESGINTADAYDIHSDIGELKRRLNIAAKQNGIVSVTGAGWDPGLDSALRTLFCAAIPKGDTYTNFGPGMSMGHTVAVKNIVGVEDAVSITEPCGNGVHIRTVYVVLKQGADKKCVEHEILDDEYFEHGKTKLNFVDDVSAFFDTEHGVEIIRNGRLFEKNDQTIKFDMRIDNPSITGMLLVSAMRASFRLNSGAYYFSEIPPSYLIEKDDIQGFI